jgi:hypothetical protein
VFWRKQVTHSPSRLAIFCPKAAEIPIPIHLLFGNSDKKLRFFFHAVWHSQEGKRARPLAQAGGIGSANAVIGAFARETRL